MERLYYDGSCGLCHRAVRFVLARDVDGTRFRFAPLHGETFDANVPPDRRASLPDSAIVQLEDGRLLVRSDAALHILERLGGAWRILGSACRILPRPLRDAAYDGVARIRKRLFAAPKEACPLLPRHLRDRFEA
jgi:predicted DCC family thiol-disulfide oxidoreductase YuxK